jgi:hypothetical protein
VFSGASFSGLPYASSLGTIYAVEVSEDLSISDQSASQVDFACLASDGVLISDNARIGSAQFITVPESITATD